MTAKPSFDSLLQTLREYLRSQTKFYLMREACLEAFVNEKGALEAWKFSVTREDKKNFVISLEAIQISNVRALLRAKQAELPEKKALGVTLILDDTTQELLVDFSVPGEMAASFYQATAANAFGRAPAASLEHASRFRMLSPDGQWIAQYQGTETGMGGPARGHVSLTNANQRPVYSAPSWAAACFSDDSRYFLHSLASAAATPGYSAKAVVECATGKLVARGPGSDASNENLEGLEISVNGQRLYSLAQLGFDPSLSSVESS